MRIYNIYSHKAMPLLLTTTGIVNELGELLFIKRANKPFQGLFSLPGGKVENEESLLVSAEREVQEELGINISGTIEAVGYKELFSPGHALVFIFIAHINSGDMLVLRPEEVSGIRWIRKEEIGSLGELPPNHKHVAEYIFTQIK